MMILPKIGKYAWFILVLLVLIFSLWSHKQGKFYANIEAGSGRGEVWHKTIELSNQRPWMGWGIGSYKDVFPALNITPQHYNQYRTAHNFILELIFEIGYPMTIIIVGGLICFVIRLWQSDMFLNAAGISMILMDGMFHFPDRVTQCVPIMIAILAYSQFTMARFGYERTAK